MKGVVTRIDFLIFLLYLR